MSGDPVPMTEEGMAKLKAEIAALESRRPAIKQAIETAREKGDLRENADYHAAREDLAMLDAKLSQIGSLLANAILVDPSMATADRVTLGCTVTFRRLKDGQTMKRTIVGAGQADPASGKILATSPLAKAMVGSVPGDKVTADVPGGPMELEILSIEIA